MLFTLLIKCLTGSNILRLHYLHLMRCMQLDEDSCQQTEHLKPCIILPSEVEATMMLLNICSLTALWCARRPRWSPLVYFLGVCFTHAQQNAKHWTAIISLVKTSCVKLKSQLTFGAPLDPEGPFGSKGAYHKTP